MCSKLKEPISERLLAFTLKRLSESGQILIEQDGVRMAAHQVRLSERDKALSEEVLKTLGAKGTMPPTVKELSSQMGIKEDALRSLLDHMEDRGDLVKVTEHLFFLAKVMEDLEHRLVLHLEEKGEIEAPTFKTLSQTTRKYTIPLLEYFDRIRLTLRLGDRRVLRERKAD